MASVKIGPESTTTEVTLWLLREAKVVHDVVAEFAGVNGKEILEFTKEELTYSGMSEQDADQVYSKLHAPPSSAKLEFRDPRDNWMSIDSSSTPSVDSTTTSTSPNQHNSTSNNIDDDHVSHSNPDPTDEYPDHNIEEVYMEYELSEFRDLDREAELLWPSSTADWTSLSNEMWVNVFNLVEFWSLAMVITRVCRQWRTICKELCVADVNLKLFPPNRINDATLINLTQRFFSIQSLDLCSRQDITLETLLKIGQDSNQRLKILQLARVAKVNDDWLERIANTFPQLEYLNVAGCTLISKRGVQSLAAKCPNLKSVDLGWCAKVSNDAIKSLNACTKLNKINLHGCYTATDDGIVKLAKGCKHLVDIDLTMCDRITDETVVAIVNSCPNIHKLKLYGCKEITDVAINAIAHGCPNMKTLNIRFCPKINEEAIDSVKELIPHCDVKDF